MNRDALLAYQVPEKTETYDWRSSALYALGVNCGLDRMDSGDLQYIYEDGMKVLPMQGMTLAHPGFWIRDPELAIDWKKALHAEQYFYVENPMPAGGTVNASYRITGVRDKGEGKGAIMYFEKTLKDADNGSTYCRVVTSLFCRGDGGVGDLGDAPEALAAVPERPADEVQEQKIDDRAALIYRLSGDFNPLHIAPEIASQAGFDSPILHGLCTMGIAGRTVLKAMGDAPETMQTLHCRFSKPVFPGETLRTEMWKEDGKRVRFRVSSLDRDVVVLDRGEAAFAA